MFFCVIESISIYLVGIFRLMVADIESDGLKKWPCTGHLGRGA